MNYILSILSFFRLVEAPEQSLSIVNVALYIILYKLFKQNIDMSTVVPLLVTLASHHTQSYLLNNKGQSNE